MEMSAIVISPAPKIPAIAHSLPLAPPPKPLEEDDDDDDDDDNDSDENEFTLFENESNNHEIADNESPLSQKKTLVSSTKSRYVFYFSPRCLGLQEDKPVTRAGIEITASPK